MVDFDALKAAVIKGKRDDVVAIVNAAIAEKADVNELLDTPLHGPDVAQRGNLVLRLSKEHGGQLTGNWCVGWDGPRQTSLRGSSRS